VDSANVAYFISLTIAFLMASVIMLKFGRCR